MPRWLRLTQLAIVVTGAAGLLVAVVALLVRQSGLGTERLDAVAVTGFVVAVSAVVGCVATERWWFDRHFGLPVLCRSAAESLTGDLTLTFEPIELTGEWRVSVELSAGLGEVELVTYGPPAHSRSPDFYRRVWKRGSKGRGQAYRWAFWVERPTAAKLSLRARVRYEPPTGMRSFRLPRASEDQAMRVTWTVAVDGSRSVVAFPGEPTRAVVTRGFPVVMPG
jgi:hypothetical protein